MLRNICRIFAMAIFPYDVMIQT
uniref:Uncharacterized protein n=1 Tax=Arundo donax TaxID=35708 RepID=A0A0A9B010_ARUDO